MSSSTLPVPTLVVSLCGAVLDPDGLEASEEPGGLDASELERAVSARSVELLLSARAGRGARSPVEKRFSV